MLALDGDLQTALADAMDLPTLLTLRRVSRGTRVLGDLAVRRRICVSCAPFLSDVPGFFTLLKEQSAVVTGRLVLELMMASGTSAMGTTRELTLSSPATAVDALVKYLIEEEGYVRDDRVIHSYNPNAHTQQTKYLFNFNRRRLIGIVNPTSECALEPVFDSYGSHLVNFICADGIFCAYPRLTFRGVSIFNAQRLPRTILLPRTRSGLLKEQELGILCWYDYLHLERIDGGAGHTCGADVSCGMTLRSMWDFGCMGVHLPNVGDVVHGPTSFADPVCEMWPTWNVLWVWGGKWRAMCQRPSPRPRPLIRALRLAPYVSVQ